MDQTTKTTIRKLTEYLKARMDDADRQITGPYAQKDKFSYNAGRVAAYGDALAVVEMAQNVIQDVGASIDTSVEYSPRPSGVDGDATIEGA